MIKASRGGAAASAASWIAVAGLAAGLAVAGFWLLFTTFMIYDDEGYVLLSLKNFSAHGALYDRVYTQYGPFPYLLYDALHRAFAFEFTNTAGRWITLINWLGTAAACGGLVARQTRSALWTAFTVAGVFTYLWVMINEPAHPGGLLAFLLALGTWLAAEAWTANRVDRFAVLVALTGAALALTKINVGVFFFGAAFAWLSLNTAPAGRARALTWLVAVGCAILPFGLMRGLFDAPWVRLFALVFTGAILSTLLAARTVAQPRVTTRTWWVFAGSFLGAMALTILLILARGTSLRGLLDGVILEPLKHPGVYFFPMNWRIGTGALALASLALAGWASRAQCWSQPRFRGLVIAARLAAAAMFLCSPLQIIPTSLAAWGMCYGSTLAWIFAVPLRANDRGAEIRLWLALVLVFAFLHAYPVAGSQMNWGTFLWLPLAALGLHDAALTLRTHLGRWRRPVAFFGGGLIAAVTLIMALQLAKIGRDRYYSSSPLAVPGAENLRLPYDTHYAVRIIRENLQAHAELLFSFPGLYSANLWTGLPTPTLSNATHWFALLPAERQQEIIARMDAAPRAALLAQRDVLDYLAKTGFATRGPLHDWLMANFERMLVLDGYELWMRRGHRIAALSTARSLPGSATERRLAVTLAAPSGAVASIDLCDVNAPGLPLITLNAANTAVTVEPIDLAGQPLRAAQPSSFPITLTGCNRLTLDFTKTTVSIAPNHTLVVLRDAAGAVVAEARLLE